EARDGYGGGTLLVRWITVGKVPAKHVSTPTLKSVIELFTLAPKLALDS
ncbi:hypothetical protein A2U01_0029013, partial [Trifolium medium]|nr:hypothetical protein [Trifolium medium]